MNTTLKFGLSLFAGALVFSACNGLAKMVKRQSEFSYTVNPNPLEMHGDSVQFSFSGKFAEKLFAKKVTLVATPVIVYAGGKEKALRPITLIGEKGVGNGQKIGYATGGAFSYSSERFAFEPIMRNAKLEVRVTGSASSKTATFEPRSIAQGIMATSLLLKHDEQMVFGNAQLDSETSQTLPDQPLAVKTHIYFDLNQSSVKSSELSSKEMKDFADFLKKLPENARFESVKISAYASPDGETEKNTDLAKDRAQASVTAMIALFKKQTGKTLTTGKQASDYQTQETLEDWEGFKSLMEQSKMADRDLILRVLTLYKDPNQRRSEIMNLSETYTELKQDILPRLRRSEITLNGKIPAKSRTEIQASIRTNPDSLSADELILGGGLESDLQARIRLFQKGEIRFPKDWRMANNLGCMHLLNNQLSEAEGAFKRALSIDPNQPAVLNNLGLCAAKQDRWPEAMDFYKRSGSPESNYNQSIYAIRLGLYSEALQGMGEKPSYNKALAQLLNGNASDAATLLNTLGETPNASIDYLKAIAQMRLSNTNGAMDLLKSATSKDPRLKAYAKDDVEFLKVRDDANFKSLTQ